MYGLKIPKTQQPEKTPYTMYNQPPVKGDYLQFVSIDPALKNLALRVERRYNDGRVICLYSQKYSPMETINQLYHNITVLLDNQQEYYKDTHYVIIERQLPQNYLATRVMQHLISYFLLKQCCVVEIDPKLKGRMLDAPKGIGERQLKKWAVEKAIEIATQRGDDYTLNLLKKNKKKDDLADVLCQIEAFCLYNKL